MKFIKLALVLLIGLHLQIANASLAANEGTIETAKTHLITKDYQRAVDLLLSVNEACSETAQIDYLLALAYFLRGEYELTVDHGIKAYAKDHTLGKEIREFAADNKLTERPKIGLVRAYKLARRVRARLLETVNSDEKNVGANIGLAYFNLYAPLVVGGRDKHVTYYADKVILNDKAQAYEIYANFYREKKNKEKQLEYLEKWYSESPDDIEAMSELAAAYIQVNKFVESQKLLSQALQHEPDNSFALYQTGKLAAITNSELAKGEKSLKKYLEKEVASYEPSHASAHWRLAQIYQHQNEIKKLKIEIDKGLKLDPKHKELNTLKRNL